MIISSYRISMHDLFLQPQLYLRASTECLFPKLKWKTHNTSETVTIITSYSVRWKKLLLPLPRFFFTKSSIYLLLTCTYISYKILRCLLVKCNKLLQTFSQTKLVLSRPRYILAPKRDALTGLCMEQVCTAILPLRAQLLGRRGYKIGER